MRRHWQTKIQTKTDLKAQILANRGLLQDQEIGLFLNPDYEQLHDPFLFSKMSKAAGRIIAALKNNEKILIYSDYDADAITANALLYRLINILSGATAAASGRLIAYIPDRFSEGYGLNLAAFEKIKEQNVRLVITVDCGTNSIAEAEFCKARGIDLIITDHHEITGEKPDAFVLINPKNPEEQYPYDQLTGVGVAYKLGCAVLELARRQKLPAALALPRGFEKWFLDLVAIGTVADCHSLLGENRVLVKYGLQVLAKTKWPGLKALLALSGATAKSFDSYILGFIIAPRINAAGRIEHARSAFDLLISDDYESAYALARQLERLNSKRRSLTETVISEAREQLALISERKILLLHGRDWPKGVVGLVAGKLTEELGRPVLVLERGAEESTGSARSIPNFNIVEALRHAKDYLVRFGGHAQAAGFTLRTELIDQFYTQLLAYAEAKIGEQQPRSILEIDAKLSPEQIDLELLDFTQKLEPFGVDNKKPVFALYGATLENFSVVGKDKKHLQLDLFAPDQNSGKRLIFKGIAFNLGKAADWLVAGKKIDLVFELFADTWQGRQNLKLKIIDLREANV